MFVIEDTETFQKFRKVSLPQKNLCLSLSSLSLPLISLSPLSLLSLPLSLSLSETMLTVRLMSSLPPQPFSLGNSMLRCTTLSSVSPPAPVYFSVPGLRGSHDTLAERVRDCIYKCPGRSDELDVSKLTQSKAEKSKFNHLKASVENDTL